MIRASRERRRPAGVDIKMEPRVGERGIQGMAMRLPIPGFPIDFDIPLLDPAFFKFDPGIFEIRTRLAIPFPEMKNAELLAAVGRPFKTKISPEKSGLDFEFAWAAHRQFRENKPRAALGICGGGAHRSGYGRF